MCKDSMSFVPSKPNFLVNSETNKAIGIIIGRVGSNLLVDVGDMTPKEVWIKCESSLHFIEEL